MYIICNSPSSIDHSTDQSRLPVAGWVLGGMLGDSPSSVVAGGSTVTGQYPVVGQCDAGAVILCGARLWADPLEAGRAGSEAAAQ